MKFSAVFAVAAASLVVATPIRKRDVGGVLFCTGANATGTCQHTVYPLNKCINMTAPFFGNLNTFAPDGEAFACYPYGAPCGSICTSPEGCTLGAIDFNYPNKYNLSAVQWSTVESFNCFLKQT